MYIVKIPTIAEAKIELIAKNRKEAIEKAFRLIEAGELKIENWFFVKDIEDAVNVSNTIPRKLYINEESIDKDLNKYLISIPCTGEALARIYANGEQEAINTAVNFLRGKTERVKKIKAHDEISIINNSILKKAIIVEVEIDNTCVDCEKRDVETKCFSCGRVICNTCAEENNKKYAMKDSERVSLCDYCGSEYYRGF